MGRLKSGEPEKRQLEPSQRLAAPAGRAEGLGVKRCEGRRRAWEPSLNMVLTTYVSGGIIERGLGR
jgi:hypothetical protein